MTAYVVLISVRGYHVISSHKTLAEAIRVGAETPVTTYSMVVRDGRTGKRYSKGECVEKVNKKRCGVAA